MSTSNKSRILLTALLTPFFLFAIYWLFGPYQIWGITIFLIALGVLIWIWRPAFTKST
jgi:hypothetical protein